MTIAVSLVFYPIYIFDSGYPQISDILMFGSFIMFVFKYEIRNDLILKTVLALLFLIFFINFFWGFIYSSTEFIISSFYYLLNFSFLIMIINIYFTDGKILLEVIYKSIVISIVIQILLSPFLINKGLTRQTLLFNNPNQLGYYSLLCLVIVILLYFILNKRFSHFLLITLASIYLAFLSNSTSTIISMLFIVFVTIVYIYFAKLKLKGKLITMFCFFIVIISLLSNYGFIKDSALIENFLNRINQKEEKNISVMEERHYNRVLDYFELTFFGAGEGLTKERFDSPVEIHSTVLSFYFNYGIIATLLLLLLFLILLNKISFIPIIILIGLHFYGLTHNGIRQPLFWLAHALIYIGNYQGIFNLRNTFKVTYNKR